MAAPKSARNGRSNRQAKIDWIVENFSKFGFASHPGQNEVRLMDRWQREEQNRRDKPALEAMRGAGLISPTTNAKDINLAKLVEEAIQGRCLDKM